MSMPADAATETVTVGILTVGIEIDRMETEGTEMDGIEMLGTENDGVETAGSTWRGALTLDQGL